MRRLVVLGAGTAGTMVVNKLRRRLDRAQWQITVIDQDDAHVYQPGLLFVPFGGHRPDDLIKPRKDYLSDGVDLVLGEIDRVDAEANRVHLADGSVQPYDFLVIATGVTPRPDQTPGMLGSQWRRTIFDFYTVDGATALAARPAVTSTAVGSSCTSSTCRSSARWPHWSSRSSPTITCVGEACETGSSSSTRRPCPAPSPSRSRRLSSGRCSRSRADHGGERLPG